MHDDTEAVSSRPHVRSRTLIARGPEHPALHVICFPAAGGGSGAFNAWRRALDPQVSLVGVRLPGRESRLHEPACTSLRDAAEMIASETRVLLDRPYVLVGHCSGAVLAFETARALRATGAPAPQLLAVASHLSPDQTSVDPISELPADQLITKLRALGGVPRALLDAPALLALVLPAVRADLRMMQEYQYRAEPPLDTPIWSFVGAADALGSDEMRGWGKQTSSYRHIQLPGDHFVFTEPPRVLAEHLRSLIERA